MLTITHYNSLYSLQRMRTLAHHNPTHPPHLPHPLQRERHRELEGCGWGSSGLQPYRPLGHMEQHVTPIRFMAARHVNQVRHSEYTA